tara:strand:- start:1763 stop:2752 length:990 start_codon:yes stop_codon:yes gene_type:complete
MGIKLIAEIGSVHNGSYKKAIKLIELAKSVGADIVKFQMHIAEEETLKNAPNPSYFKKESRFNYFKRIEFSVNEWIKLYKFSKKKKIKFMVSPFSIKAIDILEKTGCDYYKIASGEVTNLQLLKKIIKTKKKIFLSSGMSNWKELDQAVNILKKGKDLVIMQCTSLYPCSHKKVGLNIINQMLKKYKFDIGFSDHTTEITAAISAATIGAKFIEKHLTISRRMYGSDAKNSMEPKEFKELAKNLKNVDEMISFPLNKNNLSDFKNTRIIFQKSIVSKKKLKKGHKINLSDLDFKKPGDGIYPNMLQLILGKKIKKNISKDYKFKLKDFV